MEASSSKMVRHHLNRDANRALHMICVVRTGPGWHTRSYVAKRTAEGKSKWEVIRCLKRQIARQVYCVQSSSAAVRTTPVRTKSYVTGRASRRS